MPGLTLAFARGDAALETGPLTTALRGVEHFADYTTRALHASTRVHVAATGYPEYPIAVHEDAGVLLVVEGRLYGPPDATSAATLTAMARAALATPPDVERLARWLAVVDGDFVLVAVSRADERVALLNDRLARLPVYYHLSGGRALASREMQVLLTALPSPRLDRHGAAHFLCFGYPIGGATLMEGVRHLPPAMLLRLPEGTTTTLLVHDFEAPVPGANDPDLPQRLATALVEACRARAEPRGRNLVSLSGGIDSRLAAAGLARAGCPATAFTHTDLHGLASRDAEVAREVAARLGMRFELIGVRNPTGADVARLLRLKGGANYLGMAFVLPFLERVAAEHGRGAVVFTGDFGGRVMRHEAPLIHLRDDPDLAAYVARREAILPLDTVAALLRLPAAAIRDGIQACVARYPERAADQRYLHYILYERGVRWMFEGEDRNRCFFWSVSPYSAPAVLDPAMGAPGSRKALQRLQSDVLRLIGPEVHDVINASTGRPLGSSEQRSRLWFEKRVKAFLLRAVSTRLESRLRTLLRPPRGYGETSGFVRAVRTMVREVPGVADYLDPGVIDTVLASAEGFRREQFSVLLTVIALVDQIEHGGRALAGLAELTFD